MHRSNNKYLLEAASVAFQADLVKIFSDKLQEATTLYAVFNLLMNEHAVVGQKMANRKVESLEKSMNTLEVEKRKQISGMCRTA